MPDAQPTQDLDPTSATPNLAEAVFAADDAQADDLDEEARADDVEDDVDDDVEADGAEEDEEDEEDEDLQRVQWQGRPWDQFQTSGPLTLAWDYHGTQRQAQLALHFRALGVPALLAEHRDHALGVLRANFIRALQAHDEWPRFAELASQCRAAEVAKASATSRLTELQARRIRLVNEAGKGLAQRLLKLDKGVSTAKESLSTAEAELALVQPLRDSARARLESAALALAKGEQRRFHAEARSRLMVAVQNLITLAGDEFTSALLLLEDSNTALPDPAIKALTTRVLDEASDA
jgi:hypothetical protein